MPACWYSIGMPLKKVTWYVDEDARREFKAECAKAGRDQSDVIRELINRWIMERQGRKEVPRQ